MTLFPSENGIVGVEPVGFSTLSRNTMRFYPSIIDGIDSKVDVPVEKDEKAEAVIALYCDSYDIIMDELGNKWKKSMLKKRLKTDSLLLTPSQIDLVFQRLLRIPYKRNVDPSIYISVLMQKSYDRGYNGFVLHTQNTLLDDLGGWVRGTPKRPMRVTIEGDTGIATGRASRYCSFQQMGNAGIAYFNYARHNKIFISGTLAGHPLYSEDINFKTTNKDTFYYAKEQISAFKTRRDRRLALVNSSGRTIDSWDDSGYIKEKKNKDFVDWKFVELVVL